MAVFEIPTSTTSQNYSIEVSLDGVTYELSFKYNTRDSAWYLDILDGNNIHLRSGIRVVNDGVLTRLWQTIGKPDGELVTVADDQQDGPALSDELGKSVILTYVGVT